MDTTTLLDSLDFAIANACRRRERIVRFVMAEQMARLYVDLILSNCDPQVAFHGLTFRGIQIDIVPEVNPAYAYQSFLYWTEAVKPPKEYYL
jgi:hypothetical protein